MSHRAGFYDIDGSFESYRHGDSIPKNLDILKGTTRYNREEVHAKYEPEADWVYSDAVFCVIEQIVMDVTGEIMCQIANSLVFEPLKLRNTFFWEIGRENDLSRVHDLNHCAVGHDSDGEMVELLLTPYGGKRFMGLGVFLSADNGQPYFFSQGWGIGMQCKLQVYYKEQRGVTVMTNSDPGAVQDDALVGETIREVCKN